jgi:aspartate aminotransferase
MNDVLMTCGAAGGLNVIFKALLDPGDEVVILAPFFVEYHFYIDNHGGQAKVVATDKEFNLDLAAIDQALTEKTKVVLINSPNNPTGQIYPAEAMQALGRLLDEAGRGSIPLSIWFPTNRIATSFLTTIRCRR